MYPYPAMIALQGIFSWASTIALVVLLFVAWQRLGMSGFLVVAVGGVLNLLSRIAQAIVPPMRMGHMPFSGMLTLDDESRSVEFLLIYSCHITAGALIVVGTMMVLLAWSKRKSA